MPGATSGWPTAPSRIASNLRSWSRPSSGQRFAGLEVAVAAPVEIGELELDVFELGDGLENLHAFGGDFGPGAVAADDGDLSCARHDRFVTFQ